MTSHSAASTSATLQTSDSTWLARLPSNVLSHVCSYFLPNELLVSLDRSAKCVRDLLTADYFCHNWVELSDQHLVQLASRAAQSSPFQPHTRSVLSKCCLFVKLKSHESVTIEQLIDSLDHFPSCLGLAVYGSDEFSELTDSGLYKLLHHPATLACEEIQLFKLMRRMADMGPVRTEQPQQTEEEAEMQTDADKQFEWTDIRLPLVRRLNVLLTGISSSSCLLVILAELRFSQRTPHWSN